jgi:hypothetical protein
MSVVVLSPAVVCLQAYAKELVHQPLPPGDRWSQGVCGMRRIVPALVVGAANGKFMFLDLYSPLEAKMRESNHPVFVFYFNKDHLSRQGALLLVPTLTKALTARP